jgi:succinoglycan biosynthesis transport protein ExoP
MVTNPDTLSAALARQKWILLTCVGLSLVLAYTAAFFMPGIYQASARVMVDPSRYTIPGLGTEAEIVRSGVLAEAVITNLNLTTDPEFTGVAIKNSGGFLSLSVGSPQKVSPETVARFQRQVKVEPIAGSYVLVISFISSDPVKAATIANELAAEYVRRHSQLAPVPLSEAATSASSANGDRLARLLLERKELSERYGPKHPRMLELEADIAAARQTAPVTSGPQLKVARAGGGPEIVAEASVPSQAYRTTPGWVYAAAPFLGLMLGLLLAGMNEQLDRGFKNQRDLEAMTGLKVTGLVPVPKDSKAALVLQKPAGITAESVRSVRAAFKLIGEKEGRQIKVVTVTSSQEEEARALLGLWLGRLAARSGEKVLIIDANLRQPSLHTLLERSNTPSLVDYLTGQNYIEQVIWKQDNSGAHMIFGSEIPNTALDLIGSEKMKKLSGYLRQGYDLVVMIAPPCLATADAAILANESDQTLYVVTIKTAERSKLAKGLKLFEGFGYSALSLVMTDPKAAA